MRVGSALFFVGVIGLVLQSCGGAQRRPPPPFRKSKTNKYMVKYGAMVKKLQTESLGTPDLRVGSMVSKMKPGFGWNADEMGTYMEGDILMPRQRNRPHVKQTTFRWPGGIVYYRIEGRFSSHQRNVIQAAMEEFHDKTCVRFRPWTGRERHFVAIENRKTGCWSALGRAGGRQRLNLQTPGCTFQIGVPLHELMHVLGIFHEHVRIDRDEFVKIGWKNIEPGMEHNFVRRSYTGLESQYDYSSVMHYSSRVFSRNNMPTIFPKVDTGGGLIGQRTGFSPGDIEKVNRLYECPAQYGPSGNEATDYGEYSYPGFPLLNDDADYEEQALQAIRDTMRKRKKKGPPRRRPTPTCRYDTLCSANAPWLKKYIYTTRN